MTPSQPIVGETATTKHRCSTSLGANKKKKLPHLTLDRASNLQVVQVPGYLRIGKLGTRAIVGFFFAGWRMGDVRIVSRRAMLLEAGEEEWGLGRYKKGR